MMYVYSIRKKLQQQQKQPLSCVFQYFLSYLDYKNYVHKIILTYREVTEYYICV